jgi:CheY-like chemotaxis protein/anti-sigma regulatory factor (Ser/Thr protein kinase)
LRRVKGEQLPALISVDALRLRQVLINLLGNAIKFTEVGEVVLDVRWSQGELRLAVCDTGVGIPPENIGRVFEPFERVPGTRGEGTGLGLTVTRKLVELMGGSVRVSSERGKGSEFVVNLPAPAVVHTAPRAALAPSAVTSALSGRVLIAEDVEHLRQLIELYLQKLGLEFASVANGFEAVEAAMASEFDILLLDMEMPVMDGFEATRVLRERGYKKPIIALTAHADSTVLERVRHEGCTDVLSKPVMLDRLREALAPLLAPGEGYLPAAQAPRAQEARR